MFGTRRASAPIRAWAFAALAACGIVNGSAMAGDPPVGPLPDYAKSILEGKELPADPGITQAGCCGNLSPTPMITGGCADPGNCPPHCPTGHCIPGRKCADRCGGCASCGGGLFYGRSWDDGSCDGHTGKLGRCCDELFTCLCCPDPCYEAMYIHTANAAMFLDHARPQSTFRMRWDAGIDLILPDRNEYFWARQGIKGPRRPELQLDYHEMTMYNETATGGFAFFVETPYRLIDTINNGFHAGFGDINLGTKSLLVDCDIWQLTFQFRTYIPVGNFTKGIGNGHVSLEPSLLSAVKCTPKTWFEGQLAEWIPIGGDNDFMGMIMQTKFSANHLFCQKKSLQFVGTWEYQGYIFQDGRLTNPAGQAGTTLLADNVNIDPGKTVGVKSSRDAYHYAGPGCRIILCDKYDLGFGAQFSLTDDHFASQLYRTELRIRY